MGKRTRREEKAILSDEKAWCYIAPRRDNGSISNFATMSVSHMVCALNNGQACNNVCLSLSQVEMTESVFLAHAYNTCRQLDLLIFNTISKFSIGFAILGIHWEDNHL